MKKWIVGLGLASVVTVALACTTQVVTGPDGRTMTCVTCCVGQGNCQTNCY